MEANELHGMWADFDKKVSENTRINKEVLKRMLVSNAEKKFSRVTVKVGLEVVVVLIMAVYFLVNHVSFQPTLLFYVGLTTFVTAIGIPIMGHIRYFNLLNKLRFSESVLSVKKKINESERVRAKNSRRDRYMVLLILLSAWFISHDYSEVVSVHSKLYVEPVVILAVIVSVVVVYAITRFRNNTLDKLTHELAEIEALERD